MWVIPLTVLMIILGLIYIQERHYQHIYKVDKYDDITEFDKLYGKTLQEIVELKARVDALTVRAGFKL